MHAPWYVFVCMQEYKLSFKRALQKSTFNLNTYKRNVATLQKGGPDAVLVSC